MNHINLFNSNSEYELYKNSSDYILPNISYIEEIKSVKYEPKKPKKTYILRAKYNATPDNLVAFTGATNVTSLNVNGTLIKVEPIKNEITTFDVLGENISMNLNTGEATFPESYLIKSPVSNWSFKAKDPNYVINENTYICMLAMMDGMMIAQPIPPEEMSYAFTTNDGVTIEVVDEFMTEMNMQIQSGMQICFTLVDMDMNSGTFVFIDTEHQTNVTSGGMATYSFDSEGLYDVEIELADPDMKDMQFVETSLISIEIGSGITTIGNYAFDWCEGLTGITIPDSVTSIGRGAFKGCSGLTGELVIPDSVTSISENAFAYCSGLTGELVIPDSVTSIGNYAFYKCSGLTSIVIPDSVTSISENAFAYCSGLTGELVIPDSVTSIREGAFLRCSGMTGELVIPDSVTSIGGSAFSDCYGLTGITIPDSVTSIGNYAFYNCSGLTSIVIGSGVTTIGNNTFNTCTGLTSITCYAPTAPSIEDKTFNNVSTNGTLYVPTGSDYSSWMSTSSDYLGYYNWTIQYI